MLAKTFSAVIVLTVLVFPGSVALAQYHPTGPIPVTPHSSAPTPSQSAGDGWNLTVTHVKARDRLILGIFWQNELDK
jgi:hypothetical protein